jgi:ketosteroid isomerase-like protein
VSRENEEIVRRAIHAFNRGDFDAALEDAASEATIDMSRSRGPDAGIYVGQGAIRRLWAEMTEPFEQHTMTIEELGSHGERVVALITARMRGRGGIELEAKSATVATFSDGRLVRWTMYQDKADALEAIGAHE